MPNYRRADIDGGTYFFTVVSYRRQTILCDEPIRIALRNAIKLVQQSHPFIIDAWVLMPDHLHCIWTLPKDDHNYSLRWNQIKRRVSIACPQYKNQTWLSTSKTKHRESTIWQRRFWEHQIKDDKDFNQHMDYIHYNPVKHELCQSPSQWEYSTFHKYVDKNIYSKNWGHTDKLAFEGEFGE